MARMVYLVAHSSLSPLVAYGSLRDDTWRRAFWAKTSNLEDLLQPQHVASRENRQRGIKHATWALAHCTRRIKKKEGDVVEYTIALPIDGKLIDCS